MQQNLQQYNDTPEDAPETNTDDTTNTNTNTNNEENDTVNTTTNNDDGVLAAYFDDENDSDDTDDDNTDDEDIEEEISGEISIEETFVNQYGNRRAVFTGDTHEIMKTAGVKSMLDWDDHHATWDPVMEGWRIDTANLDKFKRIAESQSDSIRVNTEFEEQSGVETQTTVVRSYFENHTPRVRVVNHEPGATDVIDELDWDTVHQKWIDVNGQWEVDADALAVVRDVLEDAGYSLHIGSEVRNNPLVREVNDWLPDPETE